MVRAGYATSVLYGMREEIRRGVAGAADGDLGARMAHVFAAADGPVLLMGSDCPTIEAISFCAAPANFRAAAGDLPARRRRRLAYVGLAADSGIFATCNGERTASWLRRGRGCARAGSTPSNPPSSGTSTGPKMWTVFSRW